MPVPLLESTYRHDVDVTAEQGAHIGLEMDLIQDRGSRTELHEEVHVRVLTVVTAGNGAARRGAHRVPSPQERRDRVGVRHDHIPRGSHEALLTASLSGDRVLRTPSSPEVTAARGRD